MRREKDRHRKRKMKRKNGVNLVREMEQESVKRKKNIKKEY